MRWVTREEKPPKSGDLNCEVRFAWIPTKVGRFTVWMEPYEVWSEFFEPANGAPGWWVYKQASTRDYYC